MKDLYYLLGLIVALPLLLSSVGATEITPEICAEIDIVLEEAVERGDMDSKQAGRLIADCNSLAA